MLNLVIFGAPGSGKGTQSAKLIDEYSLYHISTGEVLRHEIASGSELGKLADSFISKGQLIPDDLMIKILDEILLRHLKDREGVTHYILLCKFCFMFFHLLKSGSSSKLTVCFQGPKKKTPRLNSRVSLM